MIAHVILLILTGWVLKDWLREEPAWRRRAGVFLALALLWTATSRLFTVPTSWLTPLHEGPGCTDILQLYGAGAHAGPNYGIVREMLGASDLPSLVRMNLWLAGLNTLAYLLLGWRVLGRFWPALLMAAFFAGNPNSVHAALSEVPAQLLTAYFFIAFLAGAMFWKRPRLAPLALLLLACALACWTRVEMAGPAAAAILFAGLRTMLGPDFVSRWFSAIPRWSAWKKWLLLAALALLSVRHWDILDRRVWVLEGLRPLNPSFLLLPVVLWNHLPLGLVLLCVAGIVHGLRRCGGFLGLPLAMLVLFRVYHAAAGWSYCDVFRYAAFWTPWALTLALFGLREASALGRRAWVLIVLLFLVPPGGPVLRFFRDGAPARGSWLWNGHNQREVRYLLEAQERHPDAVLAARLRDRWAFFGKPLPFPLFDMDRSKPLDRVLQEYGWLAGRMLFYHGIDCNLVGAEACADPAGLRAVGGEVFENPRLCDPSEYGAHTETLALGLFESRVRAGAGDRACPSGASAAQWLSLPPSEDSLRCAEAAGPGPEERVEIARGFAGLGLREKALGTARRALETRLTAAGYRELYSIAAGAGDAETAARALEQAHRLGPQPQDLVELAKLKGARGILSSSGRIDAASAIALSALAEDRDMALAALARAEQASPKEAEQAEIARAYARLGEPAGTARALRGMSHLRASLDPREYVEFSNLALQAGEPDAARIMLERAEPGGLRVREYITWAGLASDAAGALRALRKASLAGPSLDEGVEIARAYIRLERRDEASGAIREALAKHGGSRDLARLAVEAGEAELAFQALDASRDAGAWIELGLSAPGMAKRALDRALAAKPGPDDQADLALLLQAVGERKKALGILDRLISAKPKDARLRNHRGVLLALEGRRAEAAADLEKALLLDPELWDAYLTLGGLLSASGEKGRALDIYNQALTRGKGKGDDPALEAIRRERERW